jgi:hypothetical protein
MNNLQYIVKDSTRYAMHAAVELCEQGDFDSIREALIWLRQERDDAKLGSGTLTAEQVRETVLKHGKPRFYGDWKEIADELNAMLGGKVER